MKLTTKIISILITSILILLYIWVMVSLNIYFVFFVGIVGAWVVGQQMGKIFVSIGFSLAQAFEDWRRE